MNGNSRQIQFSMKLEYQTIIKAKLPQMSNASLLTYNFSGVFVVTQGDEACVSQVVRTCPLRKIDGRGFRIGLSRRP